MIHHLDELVAALAAGESELYTPPDALGYLGAGYLAAMVAEAQKIYADVILWVDAGADAGAVMAGLRCGLKHFTLSADEVVMRKLQQMAEQAGAVIRALPKDAKKA